MLVLLSQTLNQDVVFANLYSFHLIKNRPTIQYYQELAILWIHEVENEQGWSNKGVKQALGFRVQHLKKIQE
jgi:hypothetical protein